MNSTFFSRTILLAPAVALALAAGAVQAQATSAPLRVILPVSAGSGVDVIARTVQPALVKSLGGQPVVIENLPGAGGITGTQALVKAAPDGKTIGMLSNNHAVNPSVFKKLPYDSLADITPISVIGGSPFVLLVNPTKVPAKNAKELQAMLKAKPDFYNYGSSGNGTIIQLANEMFLDAADVKVKHIPYKGIGPMLNDLLGGQIDMAVSAVSTVQGHLKSGQLRAIGVMSKQRVLSLPDVPTLAEQGFPDVDISGWVVVVGPAKLPKDQVTRIRDALVTAFNDPDVKAAMAKQDNVIDIMTPEATAQFLKTEQERYARLVKKADIKID
jgi:tripartite-type tricarboxylate transporter receptor subunit TctC